MLSPTNGSSGYGSYAAFLAWTDAAGVSNVFYPDLVVSEKWSAPATATEHPVEQGANVTDHVRVELQKCTLSIFATNEPIGANTFGTAGPAQTIPLEPGISAAAGTSTTSVSAVQWNSNLTARGIALAAGDLGASLAAEAVNGVGGGILGFAAIVGAGLLEGLLLPGSISNVNVSVDAGLPATDVYGSAAVQLYAETTDFVLKTIDLLINLRNTNQIVQVFGSKQTLLTAAITDVSYTREEDTGTGADIVISLTEVRYVQTQTVAAPLPTVPSAASTVSKGKQNPAPVAPAPAKSVLAALIASLTPSTGPSLPGVP